MRIAIPEELREYIRLRDGEIVYKKQLPETLTDSLVQFKEQLERIKESKKTSF